MKPPLRILSKLGLLLTTLTLLNNCGTGAVSPVNVPPALPAVIATTPAANTTGVAVNTIAISAKFSRAMTPATISTTTFTLINNTTGQPVAGTVTINADGTVATFLPNPPTAPATSLPANTSFTATITNAVQDLAGNHPAGNFFWSFSTGGTEDLTAPAVILTSPINGTTGVAINGQVTVTFSEPLLASSVNTSTVTLSSAAGPMTGTVSFNGTTIATFIPTGLLVPNTVYTATITTGVEDLAGNFLPVNSSFSFTTIATADTTRPTVTANSPANNSVNVPVNTPVTVTFSEPVSVASVNAATFTLNSAAGPVPGVVSVASNGTSATFTPTSQLKGKTAYVATITTGVTDQAGNHMLTDFTFTFSTDNDTIPPQVISTVPPNGTTNVPRTNPVITVTFNEPMAPNTINSSTFTLTSATINFIAGNVTLSSDGTTAQFVPLSQLDANTLFTAAITTNATDLAGNRLVGAFSWSFSTGP